jgi:hypothetical protein
MSMTTDNDLVAGPRLIISLRIFAPFSVHDSITELMSLNEMEKANVGPPLAVRHKQGLDKLSLSRQSWSLKLVRLENPEVEVGLSLAEAWMRRHAPQLDSVRSSGYRNELYISVWPKKGHWSFVCTGELLKTLNELCVDLLFDCYSGLEPRD